MTLDTLRATAKTEEKHVDEKCRECGALMQEVFRTRENSRTYVWFKCGDAACGSQALRQLE